MCSVKDDIFMVNVTTATFTVGNLSWDMVTMLLNCVTLEYDTGPMFCLMSAGARNSNWVQTYWDFLFAMDRT